jgi:DNA sulfur modification protein DndD
MVIPLVRNYLYELGEKALVERDDSYVFILWSVFKNLNEKGRISRFILEDLKNLDLEDFNFKMKKSKGSHILRKLKDKQKSTLTNRIDLKLDSIQIKNFRGFGSLDNSDKGFVFHLHNKKNIFFAPNGGGKTSLCEALEYSLTDNVKECVRRKIRLKQYISRDSNKPEINIKWHGKFIDPLKLTMEDHQFFGQGIIEKNRLNEFSFLGSKDTGVTESDIMAVLLGLGDLDDLINSFVNPRSFTVDDYKRNITFLKNEDISKKHEQLTLETTEYQNKINDLEVLHLKKYSQPFSEVNHLIEAKEKELDTITKEVQRLEMMGLQQSNLIKIFNSFESNLEIYQLIQEKLAQNVNQINLDVLYNIILKIHFQDKCPACDTDLSIVKINPKIKAKKELDNLSEIQNSMKEFEKLTLEMNKTVLKFVKEGEICLANFKIDKRLYFQDLFNMITHLNKLIEINHDKMDLKFYLEFWNIIKKNWSLLTEYQNKLQLIIKDDTQRKSLLDEIKRTKSGLIFETKQLREMNTIVSTYTNEIKKKNDHILKLKKHQAKLTPELNKESEYNLFVDDVKRNYGLFLNDLKQLKKDIEKAKLNDIENNVIYYYQAINKHDDDNEYVTDIKFIDENNNYKIFIKTKTFDTLVNATAFLSEGHMRSLGLSIMLAIAKKNNLPIIVFDDVVNAIDTDHRANIIDLIFNDSYLRDTQMIITTHDRLFWERFSNTYELKQKEECGTDLVSYILINSNKGIVGLQYNVSFREKIQQALSNYDIRQALIYSRIWFESIAIKYCTDNSKELTGKFSRDIKSNLLKPSLESIYKILDEKFKDNHNINIIRKDLINREAQNQEHHTFDENSYNFVHSKNNSEIQEIFNAVRRFSYEIDKEISIIKLECELAELTSRKTNKEVTLGKPGFLEKAPPSVVSEFKSQVLYFDYCISQINSDLDYLNRVPENMDSVEEAPIPT